MEKEKAKNLLHNVLLRLDSDAGKAANYDASNTSPYHYIEDDDEVYEGMESEEVGTKAIKYPFFEAAFGLFIKMLADSSMEEENDAISSDLAKELDSSELLDSAFGATPNAENETLELKKQISSFKKEFGEGISAISEMLSNDPENAYKEKLSRFVKIVKRFDYETEDFGPNTYRFALERLYMDLLQITKGKPWASDIFDYFAMSGKGSEEKAEVYKDLVSSKNDN